MSIKHHVERKCRRTAAAGMLAVVCVVCQYVYTCNVCECVEELIRLFSTHMFPHIFQGHGVFLRTKMYVVFTSTTKEAKVLRDPAYKKCARTYSLAYYSCWSVLEAES